MAVQSEQRKLWDRIVAKAWADEDYKKRLLADPAGVLRAEGMNLPEGLDVRVVEATENQAWYVLPPQTAGEIAEGEERLAAWWQTFV